jgi:hypothetical protein
LLLLSYVIMMSSRSSSLTQRCCGRAMSDIGQQGETAGSGVMRSLAPVSGIMCTHTCTGQCHHRGCGCVEGEGLYRRIPSPVNGTLHTPLQVSTSDTAVMRPRSPCVPPCTPPARSLRGPQAGACPPPPSSPEPRSICQLCT